MGNESKLAGVGDVNSKVAAAQRDTQTGCSRAQLVWVGDILTRLMKPSPTLDVATP